jgi:two-component system, LytTR family, response regulator
MLKCIAIDDEPLALEIITSYCGRTSGIDLVKTFSDTEEAGYYLKNYPVDLLLIDIQMPDQDGISFYKKLENPVPVIFCTAFSQYAVEGFTLNAVDYLLKPIEFSRFEQAVKKATDFVSYLRGTDDKQKQSLYVRAEYSLVKILFSEIEYIETLDDYLKIHLNGRKPVLTKMNLKNMQEKLNPAEFVRVHRSFIVPLSKIRSVRNKTVHLSSIAIPVGIKYHDEFMSAYTGK